MIQGRLDRGNAPMTDVRRREWRATSLVLVTPRLAVDLMDRDHRCGREILASRRGEVRLGGTDEFSNMIAKKGVGGSACVLRFLMPRDVLTRELCSRSLIPRGHSGGLLDLRPAFYAVAAVVVLSVLFWLPLVLGITRALRQAVHATREITLGRFDVRGETQRRDELGLLGESINRMAQRLDHLVNGQKNFLADVAHELGSPLGRLQVGAAILQERVSDDLQDAVKDVQEEVQQMGELLGELLDFTKSGLHTREAKIQPVLLSDAVSEAIRREAIGGSIDVEVDETTVVGGDAPLLVKVISNVIRNAMRYAGPDAKIGIVSEVTSAKRVSLRISDDGPGVPPEALLRLGEAFYRPDMARNRPAGGTGLGLSIVRESIEAMGGVVGFANGSPQGFVVTIELNLQEVSAP